MAFVPQKRQIAAVPIKVTVYNDAGKPVDIEFVAQYQRHKKSEIDELADALANKFRLARGEEPVKNSDGSTPLWADMPDLEFIKGHMRGWSGIKDESGNDLAYSAEALEDLVDSYPELVGPLFNGVWESHRGARQKN